MIRNKHKALGFVLFGLVVVAIVGYLVHGSTVAVLDPKGVIAEQQRDLLVFAVGLSMFVVLPVFALTGWIAWKYRAGNTKATYAPRWDTDKRLEALWWGLPMVIILILSIITWRTSHALDPYKPLVSDKEPVTVQVIALPWKWMFIYPEQNIATVNYLQIPEKTPINFKITSDAPMNSFWIPQLGGQVYAMTGMETKLHLEASETGKFNGVSANISGEGFADMNFTVDAVRDTEFKQWVGEMQGGDTVLSMNTYETVAEPGTLDAPLHFASVEEKLYDNVIDSFLFPEGLNRETYYQKYPESDYAGGHH